MLHLQVSHLKIPIHYIVYGKITPFTDQFSMHNYCATLFCVCSVEQMTQYGCVCKGTVLKDCRQQGCFSLLKICSIIQPLENIQPLLINRVYTWFARQPVQSILSTTWWLMNCLLKKWISHKLYAFCIFCMDTCMHWDELKQCRGVYF